MKRFIGVIGGSKESEHVLSLAYRVGRLIAEAGCILVCGGLGGVMEAAARGAKEAGGITIGILPTGSRFDANPYIDIPIATNMGHARNAIIAHTCDSLIAVGGKFGTLSEIGFGLALGKVVVSLSSWNVSPEVAIAENPEKAVFMAIEAAKQKK